MKKQSIRRLFVYACFLLMGSLPWGCTGFERIVADHCCAAEQTAYDSANAKLQTGLQTVSSKEQILNQVAAPAPSPAGSRS